MNKEHIIGEIRRTAKANDGVALGSKRFQTETGIAFYDWYGKFWRRWGDALREAGFEPNSFIQGYEEGFILEKLIQLTRRLERVPVRGDLLLETRADKSFPSANVFDRLGTKQQRAVRVLAFCQANPGHDDVAALWSHVAVAAQTPEADVAGAPPSGVGYVYLLKHGSRREYKIGRTNNLLRREGEVRIELPEKLTPIHYIETDDPAGIETYWHTRFASKRKEGEWFALTAEDVRAFKRWKRIY
jgi:hypothetical protein